MGLMPIDSQGSVPQSAEIARIQRPRPAGSDDDSGAADEAEDAVQGRGAVADSDGSGEEPQAEGERQAPRAGTGGPQDAHDGTPAGPDGAGNEEDGTGPHIDIRV